MKRQIYIAYFLTALCFLFYLYHLIFLGTASLEVSLFDGSLRILPHYYIANGWIPYKDFGIVYPPGLFILIGKLIPFHSILERNIIFSCLQLIIGLISLWQIMKLTNRLPSAFITCCGYLLFSSMLILLNPNSDLFTLPLLVLITLLILRYLKQKRFCYLLSAAFILIITTWLRWDWPLLYIFLQWGILIAVYVCSYIKTIKDEKILNQQWFIAEILSSGFLLGSISLLFYFWFNGAVNEASDFIINIPLFIISPYRRLPLPSLDFHSLLIYLVPLLWLIWGSIIIIFLHKRFKTNKLKMKQVQFSLYLWGTSALLLPYTFSRVSWIHTLPMWYLLGNLWLIWFLYYNKKTVFNLLIFIMIIPLLKLYVIYFRSSDHWLPRPNQTEQALQSELDDCRPYVLNMLRKPLSLFVGRISYQRYIINNVALYLLDPKIKPATAFISDEPGLQNSCHYGKIIAQQLAQAPKPMLAFLEEGSPAPEQNMTQQMSSCGQIEKYLTDTPFSPLGSCQSSGLRYQIRLYNNLKL